MAFFASSSFIGLNIFYKTRSIQILLSFPRQLSLLGAQVYDYTFAKYYDSITLYIGSYELLLPLMVSQFFVLPQYFLVGVQFRCESQRTLGIRLQSCQSLTYLSLP